MARCHQSGQDVVESGVHHGRAARTSQSVSRLLEFRPRANVLCGAGRCGYRVVQNAGEVDARIGWNTGRRCSRWLSSRDFVPADHPLRLIRLLVNETGPAQRSVQPGSTPTAAAPPLPRRSFAARYAGPGVVLGAQSERQLMEQVRYNCCTAGSSAWPSTTRSGTTPASAEPRAAARVRRGRASSPGHDAGRQGRSAEQGRTSRWTARSSRPGPATRASPRRTAAATTNSGTGRNAQADWKGRPRSNDTTPAPPIPTRGCSGRATTPQPSWPSRAMC